MSGDSRQDLISDMYKMASGRKDLVAPQGKHHPIIRFNSEMFDKVRIGTKTVTRRPETVLGLNWFSATGEVFQAVCSENEKKRALIEITAVRREPLNSITAEEAILEGSYLGRCSCATVPDKILGFEFKLTNCHIHGKEFRTLWDEIYQAKGYGWDENPPVWVLSFRLVDPARGQK